jgi:hypothetical protein
MLTYHCNIWSIINLTFRPHCAFETLSCSTCRTKVQSPSAHLSCAITLFSTLTAPQEGGALFALGLIHASYGDSIAKVMLDFVNTSGHNDVVHHGAPTA